MAATARRRAFGCARRPRRRKSRFVFGSTATNSSPPQRQPASTVRSDWRTTRAVRIRTLSPTGMAVAVVDGLEVLQVEHDRPKRCRRNVPTARSRARSAPSGNAGCRGRSAGSVRAERRSRARSRVAITTQVRRAFPCGCGSGGGAPSGATADGRARRADRSTTPRSRSRPSRRRTPTASDADPVGEQRGQDLAAPRLRATPARARAESAASEKSR